MSEEFYTTEQKILKANICLFQPFGRSKWLQVIKTNHHSLYENWDIGFLLFLFHPFLETMLLPESLISRIFLKPNRFWFQKNDGRKQRLTSEGNARENTQNDKIIINTIYMKPDFPIIKKNVRKSNNYSCFNNFCQGKG